MPYLIGSLFLGDLCLSTGQLAAWSSVAIGYVWPVLLLVIGLGLVIFVHELGHFVAAKLVGIKVETFALGFGPRLFGFTVGETEYRVSALPVGGYVKMLGQDDLHPEKRVDDQRSLNNKTVGQRFLVFASGVVMNGICALLMFIILFRFTGVDFQRAQVGNVLPDSPAQKAGILPDDSILAVDDNKVRDFGELSMRIALAPQGQPVRLLLRRPGVDNPFEITVVPDYLYKQAELREVGLMPPGTFVVENPGDYTGAEGLRPGDVIIGLEYDGKLHVYDKFYQFDQAVRDRGANPTNIIAERDGRRLPAIMVRPHLVPGSQVMGLLTPARIIDVAANSAAQQAGIKPGDVIASFDSHPWPDNFAVAQIAKQSRGKEVPISLLRGGEVVNLKVKPEEPSHRRGGLGITQESDYQNLYVAGGYPELYSEEDTYKPAKKSGPKELANIPVGARLLTLNGQRLANWSDLIDRLYERAGKQVRLQYSMDGAIQTVRFQVPAADSPVWNDQWRFYVNLSSEFDMVKVKSDSLPGAIYVGLHKTWFWTQSIWMTFTRLAQGSVKAEALGGPVQIATIGVQVAYERGAAYFFYFMAILGVNLAIINFLPMPFLDGGHVLFLLVEKIKGSPVSVRIQTVTTTISMVLIGVFFLFVTYNDILRVFGLR